MMDGGLLSLKWNNHLSTFVYVLSNIRKKESYTDVTLACEGKFYPAHKLILSTCSEYFEQMFERTQCKHPFIVLKDICSEELEFILSYMYVGEVNIEREKLPGLMKAAKGLRIKGLSVPDEEPQPAKSSGGSKEKRTSDSSLSPDAKRRRRIASSSQRQSCSSRNTGDSNMKKGYQSLGNKFDRNNTSSSSTSNGENSSRNNRKNHSIWASCTRDMTKPDEQQPLAASGTVDEEMEPKAKKPPHPEYDIHSQTVTANLVSAVKKEPIDLVAVYLSDSNSAPETKDFLVEDSFEKADTQQDFMGDVLEQNSASDQHTGVADYREEGERSSSFAIHGSEQQQHMESKEDISFDDGRTDGAESQDHDRQEGTKQLKAVLENLEKFFSFAAYVKTDKDKQGKNIHTGRAKCEENSCLKKGGKALTYSYSTRSRANLKKHYESMHKETLFSFRAALEGASKRGRPMLKEEDSTAKKTSRQVSVEESLTRRDEVTPETARKMCTRTAEGVSGQTTQLKRRRTEWRTNPPPLPSPHQSSATACWLWKYLKLHPGV